MKIIYFISILFIFFCYTPAFSNEATDPTGGERGDTLPEGSATQNVCKLRVANRGYNIRSSNNWRTNSTLCYTFGKSKLRDLGIEVVQPIGIDGNFIKFAHKGCSGGYAYVSKKAFNDHDLRIYDSGNCGVAMNYGPRNPAPAPVAPPPSGTPASTKGNNNHRFVMDRSCKIRNDRFGSGEYWASRGGGKRRHKGCDFAAPVGTPLKSPCSGRVSASTNSGAAGELIQITCDNGDKFKMMHLKAGTRARSGTRVGKGSRIGAVGKTGNANVRGMIPHVHLQAYIRGRLTNPKKLWNCR